MADLAPNKDLALKRAELNKKELAMNIDRMEFRILELYDEIERMKANIEATKKAISDLEGNK